MPTTQKCIYPPDSILEDYVAFARTASEAADCFLIGSVLPVSAAIMGRHVWLPWTPRSLYPNLFAILCGKPGDRKSTTIDLSELLARDCLPDEAFLPRDFSPEALFDQYDTNSGGRPDKLLLVDDANVILADWQSSGQGPRNAARFLCLHDCKGISESYRRNQQKNQPGSSHRRIPETSTSIVFGATFNIARFENQSVRTGLQRRFLYYVAEGLGREIQFPKPDPSRLKSLCGNFSRLGRLSGPFEFSPKAETLYKSFKHDNWGQIDNGDPLDEPLLSRLATIPAHVLRVAMNFEACRSVKQGSNKLRLEAPTLQLAIDHVAECEKAATLLDTIIARPATNNDAELMLAVIRVEFSHLAAGGEIILPKSKLIRRFANHGKRDDGVSHLYGQVIPHLVQSGQARALPRIGRLEQFAFRTE
jgi:Protein of unknown function (DUF3987)